MALQDVLGVLGKAIVRDASPEEVRAIVMEAPGLTQDEREDLLRIPYARIRPYQHDYYTVECDMLKWGFERTWRALSLMGFGVAPNGRTPERAFMVRFRTRFPNRTHSVRELGQHFVRFLREDCSDTVVRAAWILDLAEAERLEIESLYAVDNLAGAVIPPTMLNALFSGVIDTLLALEVVRAEGVFAHTFDYDVLALKRAMDRAADDRFTGEAFALRPTSLVIARRGDTLAPQWHRSDVMGLDLLEHAAHDVAVPVESLLATWCAICQAHDTLPEDDATLLRGFLEQVHYMLANRFLLRYAS